MTKLRNIIINKFLEEVKLRKVDESIIDILLMLNNINNSVYTLSSCAGRLSLLCFSGRIENKRGSKVLGIHSLLTLEEFTKLISKFYDRVRHCIDVLLRVRGFIVDLAIECIEYLYYVISILKSFGFKYIYLKSISNNKIILGVRSSIDITLPLIVDSKEIIVDLNEALHLIQKYLYLNIIRVNILRIGLWYKISGYDEATL